MTDDTNQEPGTERLDAAQASGAQNGETIAKLIGMIFIAVILYIPINFFIRNVHIVSIRHCLSVDANCVRDAKEVGDFVFKTNPDDNSIVVWFDGVKLLNKAPFLLKNCAIKNRLNWACRDAQFGELEMSDGNLSSLDLLINDENFQQINYSSVSGFIADLEERIYWVFT